jgi:hypothetical protein
LRDRLDVARCRDGAGQVLLLARALVKARQEEADSRGAVGEVRQDEAPVIRDLPQSLLERQASRQQRGRDVAS